MASVFKTVQSTTFLAENIWEKCQDHKKLTPSRIGPPGPSGLIIEKYTKNLNVRAPLFTFLGYKIYELLLKGTVSILKTL